MKIGQNTRALLEESKVPAKCKVHVKGDGGRDEGGGHRRLDARLLKIHPDSIYFHPPETGINVLHTCLQISFLTGFIFFRITIDRFRFIDYGSSILVYGRSCLIFHRDIYCTWEI